MAEEADLLSIGEHCSVEWCKQLDFLPFRCSHCKEIFCLEHRSPAGHQCTQVDSRDVRIPVCPVCGHMVKWTRADNLNEQVEKHLLSGCKEYVVSRTKKTNNRCSVKGCRKRELVPFTCSTCNQLLCIRHRHAQDHSCRFNNGPPAIACY